MKKKKLYYGTDDNTVIFVASEGDDLISKANCFLTEQRKIMSRPVISIKEIVEVKDIPEDWKGNQLIWGIDKDITATQFLSDSSYYDPEEYELYLSLKKKYE